MKFTIDKTEASRVLGIMKSAISPRPHAPILACVLVEASQEDQQVTFTGSDLSLFAVVKAEASVSKGGKVAIPANLLFSIVAKQDEEEIRIECNPDSHKISILGTGRYDISGLEPSDYPLIPSIPSQYVELDPSQLKWGIETTEKFASTDETQQVLTGVRISSDLGKLEFAATDGHRLAVENVNSDNLTFGGVTVPRSGLSLVKKILLDDPVKLFYDEDRIIFVTNEASVTVRALNGAYPPYRSLIPASFAIEAVLNTKQFLSAVERVCIFSPELIVTLALHRHCVAISSHVKEIGEAQEKINLMNPIKLENESIEVSFKAKYLIEALKTIDTTEFKLLLNLPSTPVLLKPLGMRNQTFLIMPITNIK